MTTPTRGVRFHPTPRGSFSADVDTGSIVRAMRGRASAIRGRRDATGSCDRVLGLRGFSWS